VLFLAIAFVPLKKLTLAQANNNNKKKSQGTVHSVLVEIID
jgi:hypothetical protein